MRVNKQYILVKIDAQLQKEKRNRMGKLLLPPDFLYMAHNLQFGEILDIGSLAWLQFPFAEIGDLALFNHKVEGSIDDPNYEVLIDVDSEGNEYRLVDGSNKNMNYEVLGILKGNGELIPSEHYMIIDNRMSLTKPPVKSSGMLLNSEEAVEYDEETILQILDQLKSEERPLRETFDTATEEEKRHIFNDYLRIDKERERFTRMLSENNMVYSQVLFVNPKTTQLFNIIPGDKIITTKEYLYPMDLFGNKLLFADKTFVYAVA